MNDKRQTLIWISTFGAIIIVPTLCLLWFMDQALRNEQLSSQEKLRQVYSSRIDRFDWNIFPLIHSSAGTNEEVSLTQMLPRLQSSYMTGAFIKSGDEIAYPHDRKKGVGAALHDSIWQIEYVQQNYQRAAEAYVSALASCYKASDSVQTLMAAARCYKKAKAPEKSLSTYEKIIEQFSPTDSTEEVCHARLLCAQSYMAKQTQQLDSSAIAIILEPIPLVSSSLRQFYYKRSLSLLDSIATAESEKAKAIVKKRADFEVTSLKLSKEIQSLIDDESLSSKTLYPMDSFYVTMLPMDSLEIVLILNRASIKSIVRELEETFNEPAITISLSDTLTTTSDKNILHSISLQTGDNLSLEFYLNEEAEEFSHLKSQKANYLWIGILSILFIIITGISAAYFLINQHRMNRLKNTFLATVTHELKTPIASCRLLVDTLLNKTVTEPQQVEEYLQILSQENLRLSRLVDNFLSFSRMERKKQDFQRTLCTLSDIVNPALESMSVKFASSNCSFTYNKPTEDYELYLNSDAITTVLINLLDNAYKYGGDQKEITLTVDCDREKLTIKVTDKGIGISTKEKGKIFQKFYQINSRLSRQQEGCGLGLSIVNYVVKAHNGTIDVDSQPGKGSTFTVSLPQ